MSAGASGRKVGAAAAPEDGPAKTALADSPASGSLAARTAARLVTADWGMSERVLPSPLIVLLVSVWASVVPTTLPPTPWALVAATWADKAEASALEARATPESMGLPEASRL